MIFSRALLPHPRIGVAAGLAKPRPQARFRSHKHHMRPALRPLLRRSWHQRRIACSRGRPWKRGGCAGSRIVRDAFQGVRDFSRCHFPFPPAHASALQYQLYRSRSFIEVLRELPLQCDHHRAQSSTQL